MKKVIDEVEKTSIVIALQIFCTFLRNCGFKVTFEWDEVNLS
jgi:hypothetical protein